MNLNASMFGQGNLIRDFCLAMHEICMALHRDVRRAPKRNR